MTILGTARAGTWFPLVQRPRPPGRPLTSRVQELHDLAGQLDGTTWLALPAEIFNKAALIASDCGQADLARSLCWRQYSLYLQAGPLPGDAAELAMQPLLNIARQHIRDGQPLSAYTMLEALHAAAYNRTPVMIDEQTVDLAAVTATPGAHKAVCTLTWAALLADGARALIAARDWDQAAALMTRHHGIGSRLLDGRQVAIIRLLTRGRSDQASQMIQDSVITEPWEAAVSSILQVLCLRATGVPTLGDITQLLDRAESLLRLAVPLHLVFSVRVGLIALVLAGRATSPRAHSLAASIIRAASTDGYCARDTLASLTALPGISAQDQDVLQQVLARSGLAGGPVHPELLGALETVDRAEHHLRMLTGHELGEGRRSRGETTL